jgi:hypothetical protein
MPTPKVTLIIKGLIAIFVNPGRTECTLGVLSDVPPSHKLTIYLRKPGATGAMEPYKTLEPPHIARNLRLEVQNITQNRVTLRKWPMFIDRQVDPTPENQDSFSWAVDLENEELYGRGIGARRSAFSPILTFKNGDLFTKRISRDHLFTQRGIFDTRDFGSVANIIGAEFLLDQPSNSTAVFHNGLEPFPIPDPTKDWEIEINNDAPSHSGIVTDANHYYKAVGSGLTEAERFLFMSFSEGDSDEGSVPAGPEAACFSGFFDESQPTG